MARKSNKSSSVTVTNPRASTLPRSTPTRFAVNPPTPDPVSPVQIPVSRQLVQSEHVEITNPKATRSDGRTA